LSICRQAELVDGEDAFRCFGQLYWYEVFSKSFDLLMTMEHWSIVLRGELVY